LCVVLTVLAGSGPTKLTDSGELYLGLKDDAFWDNSGSDGNRQCALTPVAEEKGI